MTAWVASRHVAYGNEAFATQCQAQMVSTQVVPCSSDLENVL